MENGSLLETNLNKDQFVPAYNRYGKWKFCNKAMSLEDTKMWFKREDAWMKDQTTIIPYNCKLCPNWMRNMYVRYHLTKRFWPIKKEF